MGATAFAFLDQALVTSGQLQEFPYGLFVVAIFLGFRRGFASTLVALVQRFARRRDEAAEIEVFPG